MAPGVAVNALPGVGLIVVILVVAAIVVIGSIASRAARKHSGSGGAGVGALLATVFGGLMLAGVLAALLLPGMSRSKPGATVVTYGEPGPPVPDPDGSDGATVTIQRTDTNGAGTSTSVSRMVSESPGPGNVAAPFVSTPRFSLRGSALGGIAAVASIIVMLALARMFLDAPGRRAYAWPIRIGTAVVFLLLCAVLWQIAPLR